MDHLEFMRFRTRLIADAYRLLAMQSQPREARAYAEEFARNKNQWPIDGNGSPLCQEPS